jgi:hypothetical protein
MTQFIETDEELNAQMQAIYGDASTEEIEKGIDSMNFILNRIDPDGELYDRCCWDGHHWYHCDKNGKRTEPQPI